MAAVRALPFRPVGTPTIPGPVELRRLFYPLLSGDPFLASIGSCPHQWLISTQLHNGSHLLSTLCPPCSGLLGTPASKLKPESPGSGASCAGAWSLSTQGSVPLPLGSDTAVGQCPHRAVSAPGLDQLLKVGECIRLGSLTIETPPRRLVTHSVPH